jgi:glycosyltransferase involved in cell wall biosynthesis
MSVPRLAVICDLVEENWPSMDLVAEMLVHHLRADHAAAVQVAPIRPRMRRRFSRLPLVGGGRAAFNADRLLNRLWDYPGYLRQHAAAFDLFHLCDHSYAQLVHVLPKDRTGVLCHDLDTFRCLLEPDREPRPPWFKAMARQILRGLQKAAVVFYTTTAVRRQIEHHGLLDPARLVLAGNGIAPEFHCRPSEPGAFAGLLAGLGGAPFLLHVGSCIPRKRIDVLLEVFGQVRARHRGLRLAQIGGEWTAAQRQHLDRLGSGAEVIQMRGLSRLVLAEFYRRATLVLLPSEAEGFGLPVAEALACGSIVVASDLAVLRETGGAAATYCPVADVPAWVETVHGLVTDPAAAPPLATRLAQAQRHSWAAYTRRILAAYQRLAGVRPGRLD